MTYIIIQVEDPMDLENISVLPDERELKIKKFPSEEDAVKFLVKHDMQDELLYDAKIVRLHWKYLSYYSYFLYLHLVKPMT